MRVHLGKHQIGGGRFVEAWIEPNNPAYRAGAVRDNGFLCVQEIDSPSASPIALRLESMSEEAWRLQDAVGAQVARQLWAERAQYDRKPFYMVYDHAQFGRLYFDPWAVLGAEPSVAFHTRPDARYPNDGAVLPMEGAKEQLQAFFVHEQIQSMAPMIPESSEIAAAVDAARGLTEQVLAQRAEFQACVDWDFDRRLNVTMRAAIGRIPLQDPDDIRRYQALTASAVRPTSQTDVKGGPAEHLRWFDLDGRPRPEPLAVEALTTALLELGAGFDAESAELAAMACSVPQSDWTWFRTAHLGPLLTPVTSLQAVIELEQEKHQPDIAWLQRARHAADVCAAVPTTPAKVHRALCDFLGMHAYAQGVGVVSASMDDPKAAFAVPQALAAVAYLEDPSNGFTLDRQPTSTLAPQSVAHDDADPSVNPDAYVAHMAALVAAQDAAEQVIVSTEPYSLEQP